jgi:hypothetical protein
LRGSLGLDLVGIDDWRQLTGERCNPRDALRLRAKLFVKDDLLELW